MGLRNIITIDGPAGAGKSTLARDLARRLAWNFLDTGAIYRAVAVAASEAGIPISSPGRMGEFVRALEVRVELESDMSRIFVDGRELTGLIRGEKISTLTSFISSFPEVRGALEGVQHRLGANGRLVSEGRDQGTKIFPLAGLKFFLTAAVGERARRRFLELALKDPSVRYEDVLAKMTERDGFDENRAETPLRAADDALLVDSTDKSKEEVLNFMEYKAREVFSDLF
ncbi:MAG: (d)CMP kinase [Deltaproteobacteria bacterium]|jgi:cytidylate kinase|nr:(d)CMP kinase [Deltaproteobacteria bacterium]